MKYGTKPEDAILIATQPISSPAPPCGLPVPGVGMIPPGHVGEALIDLTGIFRTLVGDPWAGPLSPARIEVRVPDDASLLGVQCFAQGVLLAPFNLPEIGATDAVLISIGR